MWSAAVCMKDGAKTWAEVDQQRGCVVHRGPRSAAVLKLAAGKELLPQRTPRQHTEQAWQHAHPGQQTRSGVTHRATN